MDKSVIFERIIKAQSGVLFIKGKPGIGKTAMFHGIAEKNGWEFVPKYLAQIDETEIIGLPDKDAEYKGQKVFDYSPPLWLVKACEKPTLIMFDEINRAPLAVRNAAMQILNERQAGDFKLNKNVFMVAVGNLGEKDGCEVEDFDDALNGRLIHYEYDLTFPEWKKAFASKHVNPNIVSFLESNLDYYYRAPDRNKADDDNGAYPSPRTWTFMSDLIGKDSQPTDFMEIITACGHSYIGGAITRFIRYCQDTLAININDIIDRFPTLATQLKKLNRDRKSELLATLKKKNLLKISKEKTGDEKLKNIANFLNLIDEDERVAFLNDYLDSIEVDQITANSKFRIFLKEFSNIFEKINVLSK